MTLAEKSRRVAQELDRLYPVTPIPLNHESPFQLLIAVMLSAQTTDKKVNEVTPALFALGADARAMSAVPPEIVLQKIKTLGLAPTKSKNVVGIAKQLVERHGGEVPQSFEELEALPGVGHKTASVVMSQAFGVPAFPVDTHIFRLARRWGLSKGKDVEAVEADLKRRFPKHTWNKLHLQIIFFGREHCPARSHDPQGCPICSWAAE